MASRRRPKRDDPAAPAFQFYPDDFLGSGKVGMMALEEIGIYTLLLCLDWNQTGFALEPAQLARFCRTDVETFDRAWGGLVGHCFRERVANGVTRWYNPRLERERVKQRLWRDHGRTGGLKSGRTRALGSKRNRSGTEAETNTPSPSPSPSPKSEKRPRRKASAAEPPPVNSTHDAAAYELDFLEAFYSTATPERRAEIVGQIRAARSSHGARLNRNSFAFAHGDERLERKIRETISEGARKPDAAIRILLLKLADESDVIPPGTIEADAHERLIELESLYRADRHRAVTAWAATHPDETATISRAVEHQLPKTSSAYASQARDATLAQRLAKAAGFVSYDQWLLARGERTNGERGNESDPGPRGKR